MYYVKYWPYHNSNSYCNLQKNFTIVIALVIDCKVIYYSNAFLFCYSIIFNTTYHCLPNMFIIIQLLVGEGQWMLRIYDNFTEGHWYQGWHIWLKSLKVIWRPPLKVIWLPSLKNIWLPPLKSIWLPPLKVIWRPPLKIIWLLALKVLWRPPLKVIWHPPLKIIWRPPLSYLATAR